MATDAQLLAALEAKMERKFQEQEEVINSLRERVKTLEQQTTVVRPTVRPATRGNCCHPVQHWKDMVRGPQRINLLSLTNHYHDEYQYHVDSNDQPLKDDNGNLLFRSADECWLMTSLVEEGEFHLEHSVDYTCPRLGYEVLLFMSIYKIIALMRYDADAPEVQLALESELEASHLCNSGPCVNEDHIILESEHRKLARETHQIGSEPCDCIIPCLRNGLVWYLGEAPGIAAAPHHKAVADYY